MIKVKENMTPGQVMREVETNPDARLGTRIHKGAGKVSGWRELRSGPKWDWTSNDYAIIDDTQPENIFESDQWDWGFFSKYGGVRIDGILGRASLTQQPDTVIVDGLTLVESPLYYWQGGKQPVPDDVEVEIEKVNNHWERIKSIHQAGLVDWHRTDSIIAFRITGNTGG